MYMFEAGVQVHCKYMYMYNMCGQKDKVTIFQCFSPWGGGGGGGGGGEGNVWAERCP